MSGQWKSFGKQMIPFFQWEAGKEFIGFFSGEWKQLGEKKYPIFCSEDGEQFLFDEKKMLMDIVRDLAPETLVRVLFRGMIKLKGETPDGKPRSFANFRIDVFSDLEEKKSSAEVIVPPVEPVKNFATEYTRSKTDEPVPDIDPDPIEEEIEEEEFETLTQRRAKREEEKEKAKRKNSA